MLPISCQVKPLIMTKKLEIIRDICNECGGEGEVSHCCRAEIDEDNRCLACGRYSRKDVCNNCEGWGHTEYKLGDEVDVFVCVYSDDYLKDALYKPKKLGDTKTFVGNIVDIPDNWHVDVKIGRKKINIKLEDIEIR